MRIVAIVLCALVAALPAGTAAAVAQADPVKELTRQLLFEQQVGQYLLAEACHKRFGGHERTKNRLLLRAKEIARDLPEATVEAIWANARSDNFSLPPLPPDMQDCSDLRASAARQRGP